MSKTTIFILILGVSLGVAIYFFTGFSLDTIYTYIQNPSTILESLQSIPQTIQQHWQNLLSYIGGIGTMLFLAGKAYSNYKQSRQRVEQNLQGINAQLQGQVSEASNIIAQKDEKIEAYQTKVSQLQEKANSTLQLEAQLKEAEVTIKQQQRVIDAFKPQFEEQIKEALKTES